MKTTVPQAFKIVGGAPPAADAAGRTSDWVSLKNVRRATIIAFMDQGNAATVALSVLQATAVAGTGSKALANAAPIWANQDVVAGDALTRQADGVALTTSAAVKQKIVVFQIDPSMLDVAGGFDCIALSTGASNAANITSILFLLEMNHSGDAVPSTIID